MKTLIKKLTPEFLLNWYHAMWPLLGALLYRFPSKNIKVIGVTGTNGKTTVVHITTHIMESAGMNVASVSSLRFKTGEKEWKNKMKMTMPGRMKLQKFLRRAVDAGCTHVIMEVTSEGVKQNRHKFIDFDTTVFTNLAQEHIEAHGSFEKYKQAKLKLFALPHRVSIVNIDDENARDFLQSNAQEKYIYGTDVEKAENTDFPGNKEARHIVARKESYGEGAEFILNEVPFSLKMSGKFNLYNALASVCIGMSQGLELEKISQYISKIEGVPGRMELIQKEPFEVIVDYAHTPDALEKVYKAVTTYHPLRSTNSKMICVLGAAGGDRDSWKRPEMGKIASYYCDNIILTNEDPYKENPERIIEDIKKGVRGNKNTEKVLDRKKAIYKALKGAEKNDIVVITGKGAEPILMTAEGPAEWDDRRVVREALEEIEK